MRRKLYIHVGPSKTGTSAVQRVLHDHDGSVVLYPKVGLWSDHAHHNLVLNFFRDYRLPKVVRADIGDLFAEIRAQADRFRGPLFISSEMLSDFETPGDFIRGLHAHMGDDFDVEILFAIRQHLDRATSYYSFHVGDAFFLETKAPDAFLEEHLPKLVYAPILTRFLETGFKVHVLKYDPAREFVPSLLAHIGLPLNRATSMPTVNTSLSTQAMIAMLVANRCFGSSSQREAVAERIRNLPNFFSSPRPLYGRQILATAEQAFRQDRQFLREHLGFELAAPEIKDSGFRLKEEEFSEIASAVADLGDLPPYREALWNFIRDSSA